MSAGNKWQFWIDRGGTFTDVVALRPDGEIETAKLLSENPEQYADAAAEGIRRLVGGGDEIEAVNRSSPPQEPIERIDIEATIAKRWP